jgi:hypothetical protein
MRSIDTSPIDEGTRTPDLLLDRQIRIGISLTPAGQSAGGK